MFLLLKIFNTRHFLFLIITIGILVLGNGIYNDFVADDYPQIVENEIVQKASNIPVFFTQNIFSNEGHLLLGPAYFKPLMFTSFSLLYQLFGTWALPYHLFQLFLYITNACLIYILFTNFFKKSTAFFLSLLFLLHPINNEVAFYISALQEELYFFFGITALLLLLKSTSPKKIFLTGILLFISLLSKETGILFWILTLVYIFIYQKHVFVHFFIFQILLFFLYAAIRIHAIGIYADFLPGSPIETLTLSKRMLSMPLIFLFYVKTFIFPLDLSSSWLWINTRIDLTHFYIPLFIDIAVLLFICFGGLYIFNKEIKSNQIKTQHTKMVSTTLISFRAYVFFMLWFLIGMVFHMQLLTLDKTVAERWFYFPIVGLLGMIGVFIEIFRVDWKKPITVIFFTLLLLLFATRTIIRSFDFRDDLTLSTHDLTVSKDAYDLEAELAYNYFKLGKYDLIKIHAQRSIDIFPTVINYTDLGVGYYFLKDYQNAQKAYQTALTYGDYEYTYSNMSVLALVYGDPKKNIQFIKTNAIKKYPRNAMLWLNLAKLEYLYGNKKDAKKYVTKAYALNSDKSAQPSFHHTLIRIMNDLPLRHILY